jgi:phosphoglycolate phosphatase-like HAD superfamily hydrolase
MMAAASASSDRLVVFDIDGTLTLTNQVDDRCFRAAHYARFGVAAVEENWGGFSHMTDSCINREIFERIEGRPPRSSEIRVIQDDFISRLRVEHAADANQFAPLSGASAIVAQLTGTAGWRVALASGGWRVSARLKLEFAGIESATLPGALGDEFLSREEIVATAVDRAKEFHGVKDFDRIVSIGDAAWDVATARNLGLPFVGVSPDNGGGNPHALGAAHMLADYTDFDAMLALLEQAEVP